MSESGERANSETQEIDDQDQPQKVEDSQEESTTTGGSKAKDEHEKNKIGHGSIPKVSLKLILASGKSSEFLFPHFTSVGEVTEYVYKNWPEEWSDEKDSITSHHVLRLIYQGRFLHENVTFRALNLSPGKRTVMHLVPREKLPQLSSDDVEKGPKTSDRSCCCSIL